MPAPYAPLSLISLVNYLTVNSYVSLVGAEEVAEEGVLHPECQHLPLNHCALNVVILQHNILPVEVIAKFGNGNFENLKGAFDY